MEAYRYGEDTLLHSIGFNPYKLESILRNGILSKKQADSIGVALTKNYFGYNFDDKVSMTRPMYSNSEDPTSILYTWVPKSISFIVENQDFIYDTNDAYYNHSDEVFVQDIVPSKNIVGLIIPEKYQNYLISDLPMIAIKSTSYANIKGTCDELINYLRTMNHEIDKDEYKELLRELHLTITELNGDRENDELKEDFLDIKIAINEFIARETQIAFDKVLKKEGTTLIDMVTYINDKTLGLPFYGVGKSLTK
ncbi:MAG: hypothetical protein IJK66_04670 [Bacilli bacterium]|nr:hypothetical protein [Bacilli bacterium]